MSRSAAAAVAAPTSGPPDAQAMAEALARWKLRHGRPDALPRWHEAPPGQGGLLAFTVLAQDPFALTRMRLSVASLLARDAADHADRLEAGLPADAPPLGPAAAALAQVRAAVASWRQGLERRAGSEMFRPRRRTPAASPGQPPAAAFDLFEAAQGRRATDAVARLGIDGLARLGFREARALTGTVTRFVGGALLLAEPVPAAWPSIRRALPALQGHAAAVGASLFLCDDYGSAALPPAAVAARLSADLAVCGAAVRAARAENAAPGFPAWAAAEEAHARAALVLDAAAPATLPPVAASRLVRAARRGAAALPAPFAPSGEAAVPGTEPGGVGVGGAEPGVAGKAG